jgi:hypothetical protein
MHSLVVFGRDALGNQGQTASDLITIDTRAPNTDGPGRIKTRRKRTNVPFDVDEQATTSECSFDGGPFTPCGSPFRTPKMKRGSKHTLEIRSTDQAGNVEEAPAAVKIKRKKR